MKRFVFTTILLVFGLSMYAQSTPKGADLAVYPNPATEYVSVVDANRVVYSFEIYNLVGKKVKSFNFNSGEHYDITDLPKGMFLVRIFDKNKQLLATQKFNKR